ncbi:MAG: hypothetical protein ACYC8T_39625, partial [Myxococcaceae bacterium]
YSPSLQPRDRGASETCDNWRSSTTGYYAGFLDTNGYRNSSGTSCNTPRPLACCRSPHGSWFRGFTAIPYPGNLGGIVGANAKCHAEFAGAHLCTEREYQWAGSGKPVPAGGAWIDDTYYPSQYSPDLRPRDRGASETCDNWRSSTTGYYAGYLDAFGYRNSSTTSCPTPRPLACCGG